MKQTNGMAGPAKRSLYRFVPAVLVMATIFIFSAQTGDELNTLLPWFQKLFPSMKTFDWGHFFAYFALGAAFDFGFGSRADTWRYKALIVVLCGLYGMTDEYHQTFVSGRTPDLMDIRNDCIGASLAMLFLCIPFIRKRWRSLTG